MSRRSSTAAALVALIATFAAACTGGGASPTSVPDPVPVKIAFLHDMSVPGSAQTVTPALLGLRARVPGGGRCRRPPGRPRGGRARRRRRRRERARARPRDRGRSDLRGGGGRAVLVGARRRGRRPARGRGPDDQRVRARSVAGHARLVVLVAHRRRDLAGSRRARRGDPRDPPGGRRGVRRRRRLRSVLDDGGAARCEPRGTRDRVARASRTRMRCRTSSNASIGRGAGWSRGRGSARVRRRCAPGWRRPARRPLALVGSSSMKTDLYLSTTDGAGDGTIVTCACVDLGSSTRPEVRRFIHDFQSRYGSPPGVFGAEGWDAGGMLLATFRAGAQDRRTVAAALSTVDGYEGLANTYRFDQDGELEPGSAQVHVFRAEGVRWDPVGEGEHGGAACRWEFPATCRSRPAGRAGRSRPRREAA